MTFPDEAWEVRGVVEGKRLGAPANVDRTVARLAIRGPAPMQHVWVAQEPDGQWCQRGLPPFWQRLLSVDQRCSSAGPPGWYVYLSPALFERLNLPWKEAEVAVEAHEKGLAVKGRATSTARPRVFPILEWMRAGVTRLKRAAASRDKLPGDQAVAK